MLRPTGTHTGIDNSALHPFLDACHKGSLGTVIQDRGSPPDRPSLQEARGGVGSGGRPSHWAQPHDPILASSASRDTSEVSVPRMIARGMLSMGSGNSNNTCNNRFSKL